MKHLLTCRFAFVALAAATGVMTVNPAKAADPSPPPSSGYDVVTNDNLTEARQAIQAKRWRDAIAALRRVNDTSNADWNNLMGFAQRKNSPPDLAAAERYYDAALRINPQHRAALEYSGELYLMMGKLAMAEERLARLQRACPNGCEELDDLRADISSFKANGNRYVAKP